MAEYCEKRGITLIHENYSFGDIGIRISIPGKEKASFCLGTESNGKIIYRLCNINVVDKEVLTEEVLLRFKEMGYRSSDWWPAYRSLGSSFRKYEKPASPAFWEGSVVDGGFAAFIIEAYEEVEKLLEQ